MRTFRSVSGIAEAYRAWAQKGLAFHYVSGSPWQLYPELLEFLGEADFPHGSFHLKPFRIKDRSLLNLISAPGDFKTPAIESLLESYPARRFILIGDSGEQDPEIFADIARRYPRQVLHIFIREIAEQPAATHRYARAFAGVARKRWTLFSEPAALLRFEPCTVVVCG